MKNLKKIREEIDSIDSKIIELFIERMDLVKEVTNYKIKNNINIVDKSRESKMLDNNTNKISNDEYKKYYKYILDGFLKASKKMQEDIIYKK